jgi:hypothetical protein
MGPPPGASPPMRMTASWSGSNDPTAYKSVARRCALNGELPSDPQQTDRQAPTRARSYAKARLAVHRRSACSGVKALRNTSDARRHAAKLCYRFGPLTPSARSANLIAGDGTKNGLSRSEQKTVSTTQNNRLTGKAPYRFESPSLQWRVRCAAGNPSIVLIATRGAQLSSCEAKRLVILAVNRSAAIEFRCGAPR